MVIDMSRIACLMKQCEPHGVEGSGEIAPMMAFAISAFLAVPAAASADRFKQPPWVDPATFFDELPTVMKQLPPMPGEEALYKLIGSVLDAAAKDPEVMKTLRETAFAADKELIAPIMWWRYNGQPAARARRTD
jgi:hypothetical protein